MGYATTLAGRGLAAALGVGMAAGAAPAGGLGRPHGLRAARVSAGDSSSASSSRVATRAGRTAHAALARV